MSDNPSQDFQSSGELAKELGLKEALTIGVGTMVGAGIFVLPRYAIEMVGPGAIFTYILAGLICIITASSIAELATGMPKSGGTYYFLSRSLGKFAGTISGLSLWLSLTFAVSFYLLGFGEYLALFIPVNDTILALIAGIFFTYINYIGAKETGKTQNINVVDGIISQTKEEDYELMIVGASKEWRFKNLLFGSIPDLVAEETNCSVLMVRQYGSQLELAETDLEVDFDETDESPAKL